MNMSGVKINRFSFFLFASRVLKLSRGESFRYFLHVAGVLKTRPYRIGRAFYVETRVFGIKVKTASWSGDEKRGD